MFKGLTQWAFVPLGFTNIFTTEKLTRLRQRNSYELLLKIFRSLTNKLHWIHPMGL